ncbi:MAG: polysaccharide pyruvyl transferase family protein [ANME-2 cluster archaeon]|nr:polysaccharide pyruvyl transferase family protein [ANME-2 cluster archaeon]
MKIALIGWYGKKNAGDEALRCVLEYFFSEYEIKIFDIQFLNEEILKTFQEMDYIILGGGGVFNFGPPAPFNNYTEWFDKINAKILILGVGVTCPIYGPNEQNNLKLLLEHSLKVSVRDYVSKFEFERILPTKDIYLIPDMAVLLHDIPMEFNIGEGIHIGICLRQRWWRNIEDAAKEIAHTLDSAFETFGAKFVFIPLSTHEGIEDDAIIHDMIISSLKHNCYINIQNELSPGEIKYLLSKMDIVIGMRLHSLIFAATNGIPVIGINYFTKVRRFMESIGQEKFTVDLGEIQRDILLDKIEEVLHNKQEIETEISESIKQMKQDLLGYFSVIKQEIEEKRFTKIQNQAHILTNESQIIDTYKDIISEKPYHIGAYIQLGMEYDKKDEASKAFEMYNKAILLEENNLIVHYLLARLYYTDGDFSNAVLEVQKLIDLKDGVHYVLSIGYEESHQSVLKFNNLVSEINTKDAEIATLQSNNIELQKTLQSIYQSITWRMVMKFNGVIERLLLPGSRRWKVYMSLLLAIRKIGGNHPDHPSEQESTSDNYKFINIPPRLENKIDIFCFPIINWDFRFQRPQQLLLKFANDGHRVFYLTIESVPLDEIFKVRKIADHIFELRLDISSNFNIYNDVLSDRQLESLIDSINMVIHTFEIKAMSLIAFPSWTPLALRLKELYGWKIVYDCMDEHTGFSNINRNRVKEEEKLFAESDLLVVSSMHLNKKSKKYRNEKTILVPNAGDFQYFSKLIPNNLLQDMKKPIIGYYGAIAEWFDNEIIEYIAQKRNDWNFVLIGRTFGSDNNILNRLSNVHFLGEKPYTDLTQYLYWFDVCIIPFKLNPLIEATHPVKFYEYLSTGKPVVSTELPELLPYSDLCYIAKDKEDFMTKIDIALQENDSVMEKKRIQFAENNTWDSRYELLKSNIDKIL